MFQSFDGDDAAPSRARRGWRRCATQMAARGPRRLPRAARRRAPGRIRRPARRAAGLADRLHRLGRLRRGAGRTSRASSSTGATGCRCARRWRPAFTPVTGPRRSLADWLAEQLPEGGARRLRPLAAHRARSRTLREALERHGHRAACRGDNLVDRDLGRPAAAAAGRSSPQPLELAGESRERQARAARRGAARGRAAGGGAHPARQHRLAAEHPRQRHPAQPGAAGLRDPARRRRGSTCSRRPAKLRRGRRLERGRRRLLPPDELRSRR